MFYKCFPVELYNDVEVVLSCLPIYNFDSKLHLYSDWIDMISYKLNNCEISLPDRIYFNEIPEEKIRELTRTQQLILFCIYSRSCDGHVREKYVKKILDTDFPKWCIPYIIKLSDEYVIEIIDLIYTKIKNRNNCDFKNFCLQNKKALVKSFYRMTSYWNAYYRQNNFKFKTYVGRMLYYGCFGYNRTFEHNN